MAKQQNDTKAPAEAGADARDATITELEQSNGSLAERVAELQAELAQRDAAVEAERTQARLDLDEARFFAGEAEGKLAAVEAQRDAFQKERDDARRDRDEAEVANARLTGDVAELRDALDRRAASPDYDLRRTRVALELNSLLAMHAAGKAAGVTHERWLSAAMLLADRAAAEVEADLAPRPAASHD